MEKKDEKNQKKVLTNVLHSGILSKLSAPDGCGAGLKKVDKF